MDMILYCGIIICLLFNYTFIKQDFFKASITGLFVIIIFIVLSFPFSSITEYLVNVFIYSLVAHFLGVFNSYAIELNERSNFLLTLKIKKDKEKIESMNINLEKIVLARTQALKVNESTPQASVNELKEVLNGTIDVLVKIVEIKDLYTSGHQKNVADIAVAIA